MAIVAFVFCAFFCHLTVGNIFNTKLQDINTFLISLTHRCFNNCDLVIISDDHGGNSKLISSLVPRFHLVESALLTIRDRDQGHLAFENVAREAKLGKNTVGRLRSNCALIIVETETASPSFMHNLVDFLGSTQNQLARLDEDWFIILSKSSDPSLFIESTSEIKFKLFISGTHSSWKLQMLCPFCNAGAGKIQTLDMSVAQEILDTRESHCAREYFFPDTMRQFNGFQMIVSATTVTVGRIEMVKGLDGEYQPARGLYLSILFSVLKPHFNFTVRLIKAFGDGTPGRRLKNGTWFGAVGDVVEGRAHIGMAVAHTLQRKDVVSFVFPFNYEWVTFATGRPQGHISWSSIFKPLNQFVWLLSGASVLATIIVLILTVKLTSLVWGTQDIASFVIGSTLEQSQSSPAHISIRYICCSWLLLVLVITTAYRSKLSSSLMFPEVNLPPQSFQELVESEHYSWGLNYLGGAAYAAFASSTENTYKRMFAKMELIRDPYVCLHAAVKSEFACILWQSLLEYYNSRNFSQNSLRSPVVEAPCSTLFIGGGMVASKRATFKTNFDAVIQVAHSSGIIKKLDQVDLEIVRKRRVMWAKNTEKAEVLDDHEVHQLSMNNLEGVVYLSLACLASAFVVLITEIISSNSTRSRCPQEKLIDSKGFSAYSMKTFT